MFVTRKGGGSRVESKFQPSTQRNVVGDFDRDLSVLRCH